MHIHFIIHEYFEAPGAYETWAQENEHHITYSRLYQGDLLPQHIDDVDFLIVMGGPQAPSTTQEECPHFDSQKEQALIAQAAKAGKVVLGICLGSQLMGEAFGGACEHSPQKEIGKFPITLTEDGINHPLFAHFGKVLNVGHWHSDMPGLSADAKILAYSEGCPRQIIAYDELVFGFQCHMELTKEVVEHLIANDDLSNASDYRFVEEAEVLLNHDYDEMNQKLYEFLDKLSALYTSKTN